MLNFRACREAALQNLFQKELNPEDFELSPHLSKFSTKIVNTCIEHQESIDDLIRVTAKNWALDRINPIDLCLLRIAICEINFLEPSTPKAVVINEILEISKEFSTQKAASFLNGVLDNIQFK